MEQITLQRMLAQYLPEVPSGRKFPLYQLKALTQLSVCRTEALGGHAQYCEQGHLNGVWYNSCKHRACPQCQGLASEQWLRNTQATLLNCAHHHVIFTIPEAFNELWQYNRERMTDILFQSVQATLKTFSDDPKYLGAVPGMLSVLHTWGRNLSLHPHIHVLISHGGLDARGEWVTPVKDSLFPQKPVMLVFRGKFLSAIQTALNKQQLNLPGPAEQCDTQWLLDQQARKQWMVHFCKRYDHAEGVAKYLARYVKGGPFNNSQLKATDNESSQNTLTFSYQSHQTKKREKLKLNPDAFIQRIVQHIPLPRKQTARYNGLYSSAKRNDLNDAREQLGQPAAPDKTKLDWSAYLNEKGHHPVCQTCGLPLFHEEAVSRLKIAG